MTTREYTVRGMTCGACVERVDSALRSVPGVTGAAVTLHPARARVDVGAGIDDGVLDAAVRGAGSYGLVPLGGEVQGAWDVASADAANEKPSFHPLLLVIVYICGVAALAQGARGGWSWHAFMTDFMAGFFLVFSFFKLLDLRGFAGAYRSYDLVARAWRPWGLLYPFIELALGVAYLVRWNPVATNIVTVVVMLIGSIGVLRALMGGKSIRCACLGTAIKLPMTTVTLIEDLGMAGMAALMLAWGAGS